MEKTKMNFQKIKVFVMGRKKIVLLALAVLLVIYFLFFRSTKSDIVNINTVEYADLTRSVRATGQVISNTDLDLSFNKAGIVKSVKVAVGDKVGAGAILATLDQGQVSAALTEAKGALLSAQAKYKKTLEGASNEDINLTEVSLKNAQTDLENTTSNQATIVSSAYKTLLNSDIVPLEGFTNNKNQTPPSISGTYTLGKEGDIEIYVSETRDIFFVKGLVNYSDFIRTSNQQPLGDSGLFVQFPESYVYPYDWIITIPNKKAPNYLTNLNSYNNALQAQTDSVSSAQSLVNQKQAELNLKKASARGSDIDIAQAEVLSAEGSLQSAQSSLEDTVIRAPAGGTITKVDIKYGELSEAGKSVITLEDVDNLYVEALINEANIANLKVGQSVGITFDAFGNDKKFTGTIFHIDPSAQTSEGVVNYKIKVSLSEKNDIIRPGMNANIDILSGEAKNVLAIPNVAVTNKDGKSFVNVVTDEKNKKYAEREVQTGFLGDNNLIEITSGLNKDDKIALTAK